MPTFEQFIERNARIAIGLGRGLRGIQKQIARDIHAQIVDDSPVDTSRFVSNWRIGLGREVDSSIFAHYAGRHGSTRQQSADRSKQLANLALFAASNDFNQPIYVSNPLVYAQALNEGHSQQQAVPGFVQRAVRSAADRASTDLGLDRLNLSLNIRG